MILLSQGGQYEKNICCFNKLRSCPFNDGLYVEKRRIT